jgi:predicted nucleic acid-binding protein
MVLADTSVWIDFLAGRNTEEVEKLVSLLENEESIGFTAQILQELMQGCRDEDQAAKIEASFEPFIELLPQRSTYRLAARIFRDCRKKGYAIRSSIDCLIAACSLEADCPIHHKDRDFTFMKNVCGIKLLEL